MMSWLWLLFDTLFHRMISEHKRDYFTNNLLKLQQNLVKEITQFSRVAPLLESASEKDQLDIIQRYISLMTSIDATEDYLVKICDMIDVEHAWFLGLSESNYKKSGVQDYVEWEQNVLLFSNNILAYTASFLEMYPAFEPYVQNIPGAYEKFEELIQDVHFKQEKIARHMQSIIPLTPAVS